MHVVRLFVTDFSYSETVTIDVNHDSIDLINSLLELLKTLKITL